METSSDRNKWLFGYDDGCLCASQSSQTPLVVICDVWRPEAFYVGKQQGVELVDRALLGHMQTTNVGV